MTSLEADCDYITMACVAYDIVYNFEILMNEKTMIWDELKDKDKYVYVVLAKYIVQNKTAEPKDIHKFWCKLLKENHWKYDEEINQYRKWHNGLQDWDKITAKQRGFWKLYMAIIKGLEDMFTEEQYYE